MGDLQRPLALFYISTGASGMKREAL